MTVVLSHFIVSRMVFWARVVVFVLLPMSALLRGQEETAPFPRKGEYVGTERCVECHGTQHRRLVQGPHSAVLDPVLSGCETCHGPGKAHADSADNDLVSITMPVLLSLQQQAAFCGRCHQDQIERHGGDMKGLVMAEKSCTDCHAVHERPPEPILPGVHFLERANAQSMCEPVGGETCVTCHPLRDQLLAVGPHASLTAEANPEGCEICHGNGSAHVDTDGQSRLITRADTAVDGVATCRSCHAEVDAVEFHWKGRHQPYLTEDVTCTTCHKIHADHQAPVAVAAAVAAAEPVTNRTCATCHVPALCTMPGSTHSALGGLDLPLDQGCATCHKGALEHAQNAGRRDLVQRLGGSTPQEQSATCLSCHRADDALKQVFHGTHFRRGVGCVDCHGPLHGASPTSVADDAEASCVRCHPAAVAEFEFAYHHPVQEGRMNCSSCHDVHGGRRRIQDLDLNQRKCVECHPKYRGPFVFAHQADRRQGCTVCHVPHGSANRRLLRQVSTQQNCLSCHADLPAFHDQTPGSAFTNCIRCHTQVHGSNHSRFFFR